MYVFRTDGYYDFDADFYYTQAQQEVTVAELVGSEELAAEYIQYNSIYLSRGHMAANSDFLYYVQQVILHTMLILISQCKVCFYVPHLGFHLLLL